MLNALILYRQERFKLIPWGIMPILILAFRGEELTFYFQGFLFLYFSILYFRLLDDIYSINIDQKNGKKRTYVKKITELKKSRFGILTLSLLFLFGYTYEITDIGIYLLFISLIELLYLKSTDRFVEYISLVKYPLLVLIGLRQIESEDYLWAFLFFLIFLITEVMEKKFASKKAQSLQFITLIILLISKLLWSYYEHARTL